MQSAYTFPTVAPARNLAKNVGARLCKVATRHDQVDAIHLAESSGWGTLMAILESYGERPRKRPWPLDDPDELSNASSPSERLAKRFKQAASLQP